MSKSPLPSHRFLLFNKLTNVLAALFIIILLLTVLSSWAINYSIDRDCHNVYVRNVKVWSWVPWYGGHWIHVESGSTAASCPQP